MNALFLAIILLSAPPDGTVLFVEAAPPRGMLDRISVRLSGGTMVHAAIVLDGLVYEATWPRVQKLPYSQWLGSAVAVHRSHRVWMAQPVQPYSEDALNKMRAEAMRQMDRRYMARGLWRGREFRGTHCAPYVSEVLEAAGVVRSNHWAETPQTLYGKIGTK